MKEEEIKEEIKEKKLLFIKERIVKDYCYCIYDNFCKRLLYITDANTLAEAIKDFSNYSLIEEEEF